MTPEARMFWRCEFPICLLVAVLWTSCAVFERGQDQPKGSNVMAFVTTICFTNITYENTPTERVETTVVHERKCIYIPEIKPSTVDTVTTTTNKWALQWVPVKGN